MENEKRLIDANALSEKIGNMKFEITHNRGGYRYCNEDEKSEWDKLDGFDSLICDAPAVDAVEVVRCRECKFRFKEYGHDKKGCPLDVGEILGDDGFCSYGERKDTTD